jgi:hypothetical protein
VRNQDTRMSFDPATGDPKPYPSHATQWRHYNGTTAWLFNPWTGVRRAAQDVGSDTFGYLIRPPGEPLVAAPETKALHHMKPSEEAVFSKVLKTHAIDSGTLLCDDCPPASYPTDKTRCTECPRRSQNRGTAR